MQNIQSQEIGSILSALIEIEPFPHIVLDNVFPEQAYRDILDRLPSDAEIISPVLLISIFIVVFIASIHFRMGMAVCHEF